VVPSPDVLYSMSALILALLVAVAVVAWSLTRGWWTIAPWPHLRPVAWLASLGAVADVAGMALREYALKGEPKPYVGIVRLAYHAEQALVLGWPAALVAVALVVFVAPRPAQAITWPSSSAGAANQGAVAAVGGAVRRARQVTVKWWLAVPPWALAVVAVAWAYPWLRLERLGYAYAAWSWACCGTVAGIAWRTYRSVDWGPHHVATLLLVAGETIAAFAYLDMAALERWDGPRAAHGMALGLLAMYLGRQVWRYRR
jgi:hypothetical protein